VSLLTDLTNVYHRTIKSVRGADHAERMENFYAGQAEIYDDFRRRFLQGREDLYARLQSLLRPASPMSRSAVQEPASIAGGVWVDLGAGTGWCLEHCGLSVGQFGKVYLVDLAPSMLKMAQQRATSYQWDHVKTVVADAGSFRPPMAVDVVTFSYSLTMIPDWRAAIENAWRMLKPGGLIGVADFYVARKPPLNGFARHSWFTRTFWPTWFRRGDVMICSDHVPYLHERFASLLFHEGRAHVPYLPLLRIPFYVFVGRKAESHQTTKQ
jgi:S-adenosylmethionine-diacylgycerolhomoserine-N-methlytransferase